MAEDAGATGGGEKALDPTDKKLQDARNKGDIPRSTDLLAAASFLGFAGVLGLFGSEISSRAATILSVTIGQAGDLSSSILAPGGASIAQQLVSEVAVILVPLFLVPAVLVIGVIFAQQGWSASLDKLAPKRSRISPLSIAKNRFGPTGLFEFFKSFLKLVIFGIALAVYLAFNAQDILSALALAPGLAVALLGQQLVGFLSAVFVIAAAIAIVDYFWQVYDHRRKLMMSRQEVVDENKDSEGDPHLKQARRQRGMDIASQRMLVDVPSSDVVIVNPEHYAVALKWDRAALGAPICVAKGVDHVAARIREVAREAGVPIHRDPPTARALYGTVALGGEIEADHYKAVAAAIRFAETARKKKRG